MSTIHERMAEHAWDEASQDFEYHRAIVAHRETFLATPHSDVHAAIAQYWAGRRIPVAQFWAIAQLRSLWREGLISYCSINLGAEPSFDRDLRWHRYFLQGDQEYVSLDHAGEKIWMNGQVENGAGPGFDDDGILTLLSDANFELCAASLSNSAKSPVKRVLAGTHFPLEIGYTSASRTLLHLIQERGVARWPYGKTSLTLMRAEFR